MSGTGDRRQAMAAGSDAALEQLNAGWRDYRQWFDARARAGRPLPPGGVFLLQREAVIRDEMTALFGRVVSTLRVPANCVRVQLRQGKDDGKLYPAIDVNPPDGWLQTIRFSNPPDGQTVRQMAQTYIRSVLTQEYAKVRDGVSRRCARIDDQRAELAPDAGAIIDGLEAADQRPAGSRATPD